MIRVEFYDSDGGTPVYSEMMGSVPDKGECVFIDSREYEVRRRVWRMLSRESGRSGVTVYLSREPA